MSRREYPGGATPTTITGDMTSSVLVCTIASATGWTVGAIGPYTCVINAGQVDEEKVLVQARSGTTLTLASRGWDGSTAQTHTSGATIQPCVAATDLDEANAHVNANSGVHGVVGGVVGTTDEQTLSGKTFSDSPTISDLTNMNHDHTSVPEGGLLGAGSFTALTLNTNWSATVAGFQVDATGWVKLSGAVAAAAGASSTIASGLPHPLHGVQQFVTVDAFSVSPVIAQVDGSGSLGLVAAGGATGHTYYLSGIGYQS